MILHFALVGVVSNELCVSNISNECQEFRVLTDYFDACLVGRFADASLVGEKHQQGREVSN